MDSGLSNEETQVQNPSGGFKKLVLYGTLLFVACFSLIVVNLFFWRAELEIGPDTTVITEPLREDGTIDYIKAIDDLQSVGVTPENNGCVLIVRAFGPDLYRDVQPEALSRLGIPDLPSDGDYIVNLYEHLLERGVSDNRASGVSVFDYSDSIEKPWSVEDRPEIAQWLSSYEKQIDMVVEASLKPRFYYPLLAPKPDDDAIAVQLPMISKIRHVVKVLACRSMLRCGSGDIEAAMGDVMAILSISRHYDNHPLNLGRLTSFAIASTATNLLHQILLSNHITAEQIEKYRMEYHRILKISAIVQTFDKCERFTALDSALCYYRGQDTAKYGFPESPSLFGKLDINVTLRLINQRYDEFVETVRTLDRKQRIQFRPENIIETESEVDSSVLLVLAQITGDDRGVSEVMANRLLIYIYDGELFDYIAAEDRAHVRDDMQTILFALALYRTEHGNYPTRLEDLVPQQMKALPVDLYSDGPFHYSLDESGGFILYSEGSRGFGDGQVEFEPGTKDLVFGTNPESDEE